jgi:hypothetical protein
MTRYLTLYVAFPLFFVLLFSMYSCREDSDDKPSITDAQLIKLKEIIVQSLPSPYYHYSYNDKGFVTNIKHASGERNYTIEYKDNRVSRMINNTPINKDILQYSYTNQQVSRIDIIDAIGVTYQQINLAYDNDKRLKELLWKDIRQNQAATDIRKLVFTYNTDGNCASYEDYYNTGNGLVLSATHRFLRFDTKTNVDRNRFFKSLNEHFLYLPQVIVLKNNPLEEVISSNPNDFSVTSAYTYQDNLPVEKQTTFTATSGNGSGRPPVTSLTTYSYY